MLKLPSMKLGESYTFPEVSLTNANGTFFQVARILNIALRGDELIVTIAGIHRNMVWGQPDELFIKTIELSYSWLFEGEALATQDFVNRRLQTVKVNLSKNDNVDKTALSDNKEVAERLAKELNPTGKYHIYKKELSINLKNILTAEHLNLRDKSSSYSDYLNKYQAKAFSRLVFTKFRATFGSSSNAVLGANYYINENVASAPEAFASRCPCAEFAFDNTYGSWKLSSPPEKNFFSNPSSFDVTLDTKQKDITLNSGEILTVNVFENNKDTVKVTIHYPTLKDDVALIDKEAGVITKDYPIPRFNFFENSFKRIEYQKYAKSYSGQDVDTYVSFEAVPKMANDNELRYLSYYFLDKLLYSKGFYCVNKEHFKINFRYISQEQPLRILINGSNKINIRYRRGLLSPKLYKTNSQGNEDYVTLGKVTYSLQTYKTYDGVPKIIDLVRDKKYLIDGNGEININITDSNAIKVLNQVGSSINSEMFTPVIKAKGPFDTAEIIYSQGNIQVSSVPGGPKEPLGKKYWDWYLLDRIEDELTSVKLYDNANDGSDLGYYFTCDRLIGGDTTGHYLAVRANYGDSLTKTRLADTKSQWTVTNWYLSSSSNSNGITSRNTIEIWNNNQSTFKIPWKNESQYYLYIKGTYQIFYKTNELGTLTFSKQYNNYIYANFRCFINRVDSSSFSVGTSFARKGKYVFLKSNFTDLGGNRPNSSYTGLLSSIYVNDETGRAHNLAGNSNANSKYLVIDIKGGALQKKNAQGGYSNTGYTFKISPNNYGYANNNFSETSVNKSEFEDTFSLLNIYNKKGEDPSVQFCNCGAFFNSAGNIVELQKGEYKLTYTFTTSNAYLCWNGTQQESSKTLKTVTITFRVGVQTTAIRHQGVGINGEPNWNDAFCVYPGEDLQSNGTPTRRAARFYNQAKNQCFQVDLEEMSIAFGRVGKYTDPVTGQEKTGWGFWNLYGTGHKTNNEVAAENYIIWVKDANGNSVSRPLNSFSS